MLQFKRWRMCKWKKGLLSNCHCVQEKKMRMFPILKSGIHIENDTAARYKTCTAQFPEAPAEEKLVFAKQQSAAVAQHIQVTGQRWERKVCGGYFSLLFQAKQFNMTESACVILSFCFARRGNPQITVSIKPCHKSRLVLKKWWTDVFLLPTNS